MTSSSPGPRRPPLRRRQAVGPWWWSRAERASAASARPRSRRPPARHVRSARPEAPRPGRGSAPGAPARVPSARAAGPRPGAWCPSRRALSPPSSCETRAFADGLVRHERPAIPRAPTIIAAVSVALARSDPGPVPLSPKYSSSDAMPPGRWPPRPPSRSASGPPLLESSGRAAQRGPPLDDRQHLQASVVPRDRPRRRARPRGWRRPPAPRCTDRLLEPDLLGELGLVHVVHVHAASARRAARQQRLVEQVLDHHRRVAERVVGERSRRTDLVVQLRVVHLRSRK
jgi:hypothetical protein